MTLKVYTQTDLHENGYKTNHTDTTCVVEISTFLSENQLVHGLGVKSIMSINVQ